MLASQFEQDRAGFVDVRIVADADGHGTKHTRVSKCPLLELIQDVGHVAKRQLST
jgi:hypothetical protein